MTKVLALMLLTISAVAAQQFTVDYQIIAPVKYHGQTQMQSLTLDNRYFDIVAGQLTWIGVLSSGGSNCTKYTVASTALTAAATSQDVTLFTLPANALITSLRIKEAVQTACSGGCTGVSSMTVSVGRTGTETDYAPAWSLMQSVAPTNKYDDGGSFAATTASHAVVAKFTVTNTTPGNLGTGSATNLTAGAVDFWFCTVTLP